MHRKRKSRIHYDGKIPPDCSYCGTVSEFASGRDIYPQRPDLFTRLFYRCRPCEAHVGVHEKTVIPMGSLANYKLRKLRKLAHAVFDEMWKNGAMTRKEAYKLLASCLDIPVEKAHIGHFDEEQCYAVIGIFSA